MSKFAGIYKQPMRKIYFAFVCIIMLYACDTPKEIVYFQDVEEVINNNPEIYISPNIQKGDRLSITVSSYNMDVVKPFNLGIPAITSESTVNSTGRTQFQSYLVDSDGFINYPVLGRVYVAGMSRQQLSEQLQEKITRYVKEPIVTVDIMNYRFTVLGEVNQPGVFNTANEKLTVLEALGYARDLTINGRRDSILIIRSENDVMNKYFMDIRNTAFVDSTYFYLKQNDVIYVRPNKAKTLQSRVTPINNLIISAASLTLALITFLTR